MSKGSKEHLVEWTYAGGWILLLLIGAILAWRMSRESNATYRSFVPFIGLLTALMLIGGLMLAGRYFPSE
ncbi:MAG: hypothetical protein ACJ74O_01380 [Frankiaceae bacterium]